MCLPVVPLLIFRRLFARERGIPVLLYQFFMDGREYYDDQGVSIPTHEFYEKVRAGSMPTTSMVNAERYTEFFTPILEEGKDVLHLEFSSGLSGSYNNALMTAEQLMQKYPAGKSILWIPCLLRAVTACSSILSATRKRGCVHRGRRDYAEALKWKITHWFAVESLEHLRRGGRVSRASAFLGNDAQYQAGARFQ